jgi:phosphotransferase system HPr-like phosphotransfer protein
MQSHYSISGSLAAQVPTLVAIAIVATVIGSFFFPSHAHAAGFIEDSYNLPTENACSEFDTLEFNATNDAPAHRVYRLNDVWHQINPCLKFLKGEVSKRAVTDPLYDFIYYQMLYVLSQSEVKFYDKSDKKMSLKNVVNKNDKLDLSKFERVTYTGSKGQAYDGMGSADFANWTLDMHRIYISKVGAGQTLDQFGQEQSASYIAVSLAVMETIITPIDKGGLRTTTTCGEKVDGKTAKCSWYHSKTSDNKDPEDGLTINKTLSVVRDLWRYGRDLRKTGSSELVARAEKFENAAVEGVHQMVYGKGIKKSKAPTLFDFVPRDKKGRAIQDSWLYYGLTSEKNKGYYLKNTIEKNCGYHKRNISLLATIFKEFGSEVKMKGFTEKRKDLNSKSILEFMIKAYEIKENGQLHKNEDTTAPGNFQRCANETGTEMTPELFAYLRSL